MNEIILSCNPDTPQKKESPIKIFAHMNDENNVYYKFMAGKDGTWEILKDFSKDKEVLWKPKEDGRYIILVQAKKEGSKKSIDYVSRAKYVIGDDIRKIIDNAYLDKPEYYVGDKINLTVQPALVPALFKFYKRDELGFEILRDYSSENTITFIAERSGSHEVMICGKELDSKKDYDDVLKLDFEVKDIKKTVIRDFKCLSDSLYANEELSFDVEADSQDSRTTLYKFININPDGEKRCVQDYSTRKTVSLSCLKEGRYKLLCLVKDMYSENKFDDRAILIYDILKYEKVVIQNFTSDVNSPQAVNTEIYLRAFANGGKNLLYRFIITGDSGIDSGFTDEPDFKWIPKIAGEYNIELWVKDESFDGEYEDKSSMKFKISPDAESEAVIKKVIPDREERMLVGEKLSVRIVAEGQNLRYSFIGLRDGEKTSETVYSTTTVYSLTPDKKGIYEIEARAKTKYSKKEYDSHMIFRIEVFDYYPAKIEYVLVPPKEMYVAGDILSVGVISKNTSDTLISFELYRNKRSVLKTGYGNKDKFSYKTKFQGIYSVVICAKNIRSTKEYDSKKEVSFVVHECMPISGAKLISSCFEPKINVPVNFQLEKCGGKNVLYEFYIYEDKNWNLVQKYSAKSFYSFIPFKKGIYKILCLVKSGLRNISYEGYDIYEFEIK